MQDRSTSDIETLIDLMAKLPGMGPRSARRAVLHLIRKRALLLTPLSDMMTRVAARAGFGPASIRTRTDRHGRMLYLVQIGSFETRQQAITASRGIGDHELMIVTVDPSS